MKTKCLTILLFLCAALPGCKADEPAISKKKMRTILWDMLMLEAYHQQLAMKDTSFKYGNRAKANEEKVFQLHGVSRQQYTESYKWYSSRPEIMQTLMDSITANSDKERAKLYQKKYGGAKPAGS
jgi:hypothetical protein